MSLFVGATVKRMLALPGVIRASRLQKQELNKKMNILVGLMNDSFKMQNHIQYGSIKIYDGAESQRKFRLLPGGLPKDSKIIVFETSRDVVALLVIHSNGTAQYSNETGLGLAKETYDIDSVIEARKQEYEELKQRSAAA